LLGLVSSIHAYREVTINGAWFPFVVLNLSVGLGIEMPKKKKSKTRNRKGVRASTIDQHRQVGKQLLPPMLHMLPQKHSFSSWLNNHLPEALWACLIVCAIPRKEALRVFLKIAEVTGLDLRESLNEGSNPGITHSKLIENEEAMLSQLVEALKDETNVLVALKPLLLFKSLPGFETWKALISYEENDSDGGVLARTVGACLDHQSQESTDVRWLLLMQKIGIGRLRLPKESLDEFLSYPKYDPSDEAMRWLRPSIRAAELAIRMPEEGEEAQSRWAKSFWDECLARTDCVPDPNHVRFRPNDGVDGDATYRAWFDKQFDLLRRFFENQVTTEVDARFEAIFGIALYCGSAVLEVMHANNRFGLSGRLLLRLMVECRITLAYLLFRNDPSLWQKFRRFGSGQAKLALLKLDVANSPPKFLSEEVLSRIANEDLYEEFLPVELGHWCDLDLRKMAEQSGTKDDYDRFYGWSSAYVHGSWSAIRDACFVTCFNPLHRLHRVPSGVQRFLESVLEDAVGLFNEICRSVDAEYPGVSPVLEIQLAKVGSDSEIGDLGSSDTVDK
jgi:hypothetical protein